MPCEPSSQPGSGRKMPESSFGRQQAVSVILSEDTFSPRQLFVGLFLQNENLNGGQGMGGWRFGWMRHILNGMPCRCFDLVQFLS